MNGCSCVLRPACRHGVCLASACVLCSTLCNAVRLPADMMGSAQEMFRRAGIELPPDMLAVHGGWTINRNLG
jgi:hypothetical protein